MFTTRMWRIAPRSRAAGALRIARFVVCLRAHRSISGKNNSPVKRVRFTGERAARSRAALNC
jgi:hypothetical protein